MLVHWILFIMSVAAVKHSDFKKCDQSGFCVRQRAYADWMDDTKTSVYHLVPNSLIFNPATSTLKADMVHQPHQTIFSLTMDFLDIKAVRIRLSEKNGRPRYDGPQQFSLNPSLTGLANVKIQQTDKKAIIDLDATNRLVIDFQPFVVHLLMDKTPIFSFNGRQYLNYETSRKLEWKASETVDNSTTKSDHEKKMDELMAKLHKDMQVETFNGHTDTKPNGPQSIGLDVSFHGFEHAFGLAEHATSFDLKDTRGPNKKYEEPYRLYNFDVFEYELNSPMALYGSIPYMTVHNANRDLGFLWFNSAEMWVDVERDANSIHSHWMVESGQMDVFLLLGPNSNQIQLQLKALTGSPAMPQLFATAYHQCRWNYNDEEDVANVNAKFDDFNIPYDVLWLDIEHTIGKQYFTWDAAKFPNPEKMQESLASSGRKMVTIIDPHIKRDDGFSVYKEAKALDIFVKTKDKQEFEGHCWPGSSSWIDYTIPEARQYWANQFKFDTYKGSTKTLYTWNDMNEPSVFSGPEVTMPKDNLHAGGWEHRDVHNLYGMLQHRSTFEGHLLRSDKKDRPFVLSRAFFIGTQRYGPIWTGDNFAKWDHMTASVPMLLSLSVSGLPFVGADVGGFFGNPEPELLVRWYQLGAFQPFFRAHAHIDTKRREPWLLGEPFVSLIRTAVEQRYLNLPYSYTLHAKAHHTGMPIMRPLYYEFPADEQVFSMDDQYMYGPSLLVMPVPTKETTQLPVYLPQGRWYDYVSHVEVSGGKKTTVDTPLEKIPVFLRGGTILTRKERLRRSSSAMMEDPFTLWIMLDSQETATGELYVDDGHSYEYEQGKYAWTQFNYKTKGTASSLESEVLSTQVSPVNPNTLPFATRIERLVILGRKKTFQKIKVRNGKELSFESVVLRDGNTKTIVKDPKVLVGQTWVIDFE